MRLTALPAAQGGQLSEVMRIKHTSQDLDINKVTEMLALKEQRKDGGEKRMGVSTAQHRLAARGVNATVK